jgi:hypothetical protein
LREDLIKAIAQAVFDTCYADHRISEDALMCRLAEMFGSATVEEVQCGFRRALDQLEALVEHPLFKTDPKGRA